VRDHDDRAARDELIVRFMGLARQMAGRYRNRSEPFEDVVQVAALGLIKAIDRFDPDRGVAFSTFAVPTMLGEVKRHFRDRSWSVRPPRDLMELALRVESVADELSAALGRAPSVPELADRLGLSVEEVAEALEAGRSRSAVSLSAPGGGEDDGAMLGDLLGDDDGEFSRAEDRATLDVLLEVLDPQEREVLRLRFDEDLTQTQIAEIVGVSQMQVSRLLRRAIERLGFAAHR
jgi:RNA polymerase sigma-B factor